MAADRTLTSANVSVTAGLGGTVTAGDSVYIGEYAVTYTDGQIRDTTGGSTTRDLLRLTLGPDCRSNFRSENGGQLRTIVNTTSTGYFQDKSNAQFVELVSDSAAGVIYDIRYEALNGHTLVVNTCDVENLYQSVPGTVIVQAACDLANAYITAGRCEIRYSGSYSLTKLVAGGNSVVTLSRDATDIYAKGSSVVTIDNTAFSPSGAIYLDGGTVIVIRAGTIDDIIGETGTIDLSRLSAPCTISDRHLKPGVTLILSRNGIQPTFTTTTDTGGGPRIVYV